MQKQPQFYRERGGGYGKEKNNIGREGGRERGRERERESRGKGRRSVKRRSPSIVREPSICI
jgi:hypothetical protein